MNFKDFHTSRNNIGSNNNLLQNEQEQANLEELLPVPNNELRDDRINIDQNNPEPLVAQPIEAQDVPPSQVKSTLNLMNSLLQRVRFRQLNSVRTKSR